MFRSESTSISAGSSREGTCLVILRYLGKGPYSHNTSSWEAVGGGGRGAN